MTLEEIASVSAVILSIIALLVSIRQQRGPDIKMLSPDPPRFSLDRDREPDTYGYETNVSAEVAIDAIVVNEGASAGTIVDLEPRFIVQPEPYGGEAWGLVVERTEQLKDVPLSCPFPLKAGENFPVKVKVKHTYPGKLFRHDGYDETLKQHEIWIQVSYTVTKKRFLIGPTIFDKRYKDIVLKKAQVSKRLGDGKEN